jgi:hypothetical protein
MDQLVANVVQFVVQLLVRFSVVVVAFGLIALPASLLIPSTRRALVRWLRRPSENELDQGEVLAQITAANEQMAALRSEVYALRSEVAGIQALRQKQQPEILLPPSTRGGLS